MSLLAFSWQEILLGTVGLKTRWDLAQVYYARTTSQRHRNSMADAIYRRSSHLGGMSRVRFARFLRSRIAVLCELSLLRNAMVMRIHLGLYFYQITTRACYPGYQFAALHLVSGRFYACLRPQSRRSHLILTPVLSQFRRSLPTHPHCLLGHHHRYRLNQKNASR